MATLRGRAEVWHDIARLFSLLIDSDIQRPPIEQKKCPSWDQFMGQHLMSFDIDRPHDLADPVVTIKFAKWDDWMQRALAECLTQIEDGHVLTQTMDFMDQYDGSRGDHLFA